jgi:hypothetical protein
VKTTVAMKVMSQTRSVEWTKERIDALQTPEVKQLRANAVRLNDPEIAERCDEVLGARPRGGGPGSRMAPKTKSSTPRVRRKKAPEAAGESA